ncbi:MAG: thiamine pyrophosphate-dependent enzyme [Rhodospirillales bacterium]
MERSFAKEVALLGKGRGEVFEGEGILAITKALLESGVAYVGGYQGAPVSHMMDVMSDARDLLDGLGVHAEACANEAGAAAMLGASINYPLRGAVTWKSIVGTNVAADALSNAASAGVVGGAVIIIGEDYGEGSSIIQERTHAFAMKSSLWLFDPRPHHPTIVSLVKHAFAMSEASNTPIMLEFRIRACHLTGRFETSDNIAPAKSRNAKLEGPTFNFDRIALPPATYLQEKLKIEKRFPAAIEYVRSHMLNETFVGDLDDIGIICQGGLYNSTIQGLRGLGLADAFGNARVPIHCLNVTYPLVDDQIAAFCAGKRAVLIVEEGFPEYIEEAVNVILRKADLNTKIVGKSVFPKAGEYIAEVMLNGIARFVEGAVPRGLDLAPISAAVERVARNKRQAAETLGAPVPKRPPGFCVGCPERPVFSAIKLVERDMGKIHISADIGCHTFSTLPPFNLGNTVLGYGLGLASSAGVAPVMNQRVVSIMGDGGFWHNGLSTGVSGALFNKHDSVLVIMANGYSSATGQQHIPSTGTNMKDEPTTMPIEAALKGLGVKWLKTLRSYGVGGMVKALKDAMTTDEKGLKVIIAEGECQVARQRKVRPLIAKALQAGQRVVRTRYGVDEDTCTGDHSCIRLSGCPSLTVKENPDPLRKDPVAHVNQGCVGCGLCGEVADAAVLCPSFYRADVVQNPGWLDRTLAGARRSVIGALQRPARAA